MGGDQGTLFGLEFNRSIRIEGRPERLTADSGVPLMRELAGSLDLPGLVARHLSDPRDGSRVRHPLVELVQTRLLALAQGWTDQNDVGLLRDDPAFRLAVSTRRGEAPLRTPQGREPEGLCSPPTLSRLQAALSLGENRTGLGVILRSLARPFLAGKPRRMRRNLEVGAVAVRLRGVYSEDVRGLICDESTDARPYRRAITMNQANACTEDPADLGLRIEVFVTLDGIQGDGFP